VSSHDIKQTALDRRVLEYPTSIPATALRRDIPTPF
jgi:hypothetical protein